MNLGIKLHFAGIIFDPLVEMKSFISITLKVLIVFLMFNALLEGSTSMEINLNIDKLISVISSEHGYESADKNPSLMGPLLLVAWNKDENSLILRKGEWSIIIGTNDVTCLYIDSTGLLTDLRFRRFEDGFVLEKSFRVHLHHGH